MFEAQKDLMNKIRCFLFGESFFFGDKVEKFATSEPVFLKKSDFNQNGEKSLKIDKIKPRDCGKTCRQMVSKRCQFRPWTVSHISSFSQKKYTICCTKKEVFACYFWQLLLRGRFVTGLTFFVWETLLWTQYYRF